MKTVRIIAGALLAPIIFIFAWTIPLLQHPAFRAWLVINTALAYLAFLCFAGLSHLYLAKRKWDHLLQYCSVMFAASFTVTATVLLWSLFQYTSYEEDGVPLVSHHIVTIHGLFAALKSSLAMALLAAAAMGLFWVVAVFEPFKNVNKNA